MRHAFWNGVSTLVFAVPLITYLGPFRAGLIYFGAGVGGGIAALASAPSGTLIVGSSGAVAGLFGAWVVLRLRSARYAEITWRARVRAAGIGFLVLPALLNPMTPAGQPISVSSHLGGLITGMLVGALISRGLLPRDERAFEDDDDDDPDFLTSST
jgi:membrane associated rhomboid family serine protease